MKSIHRPEACIMRVESRACGVTAHLALAPELWA